MRSVELFERQSTLAWPLGWAFADVLPLASFQPDLALDLLTAKRPRLHFLAFVLATAPGTLAAETISQALRKPVKEVLASLGLPGLRGVRRVLGRIPGPVMEREHYRLIAALLADSSAAPVLHHATEVSAELLENIRSLPPVMRSPVIINAIAHIPGAGQHVLQWIDIIAGRLEGSPPAIQKRLGGCKSLVELRTELTKLLDGLPALEVAPPRVVGSAVRVDTPSAIRQLGKRFHNCLAGFVDAEVDGITHLYHWRSDEMEGVCEVSRVSNLGWFLGSHLGPENDPLPDESSQLIQEGFAAAGIHPIKIIETYDDLYFSTGGRDKAFAENRLRPRHQRRGRYHAD